jgi:hypothetical protein
MPVTVTTPEECVNYVERVGICTWRHHPKLPWFPSLEEETAWRGFNMTMQTWFWKDDLHIERRLYFGMLLAPDTPLFVSLALLPVLIAAQGDLDARTLHEKGLLASNALRVYEHIERSGITEPMLPWSAQHASFAGSLCSDKAHAQSVGSPSPAPPLRKTKPDDYVLGYPRPFRD